MARWPEDTSIPDDDIGEVLDHWATQQTIAWWIARTLAWSTLLRGHSHASRVEPMSLDRPTTTSRLRPQASSPRAESTALISVLVHAHGHAA